MPGETSPTDVRDERIGAILDEYQILKASGVPDAEQEVLARHPNLAVVLRQYFKTIGALGKNEENISDLPDCGFLVDSLIRPGSIELAGFTNIECIGGGGMGIVLKAHDQTLNRTVALKILQPHLVNEKTAMERFKREAEAAGSLRHPNIITVHAIGEQRGTHYLVMEHIDGPTLADVIRDSDTLPTERIRHIFRQLLHGLKAAHDAGLIHRDIKSANILLDGPEQQVKIADFGLARLSASQTRITTGESLLGTAEYMSPEQARGDLDIDHRTDLYSAGVVLFELLTGKTPFEGGTSDVVLHRIKHEPATTPHKFNHEADPKLSGIALRLMAKSPQDRFDSAGQIIEALDQGVLVQSPEARRRRRRSWFLVGAASAVLASVVLGSLPDPPRLADAGIRWGASGEKTRVIEAQLVGDSTAFEFKVLEDTAREIEEVLPVDTDGDGDLMVVAGVTGHVDGNCVFGFDATRKQVWQLGWSPQLQWPDCARPTIWRCQALAKGNLDGRPGDELVVSASDAYEYPSVLACVDPRTGELGSQFWHLGTLGPIFIQPGFFEDGSPAIIVVGFNNKLNGFNDEFREGDIRYTDNEVVRVVMILDPRHMEGLGPPRTDRLSFPEAEVHAYAFIDLPMSGEDGALSAQGNTKEATRRGRTASKTVLELAQRPSDPKSGPWFSIGVPQLLTGHNGMLIVDRDLILIEAIPGADETPEEATAFWTKHWRLVIRHNEYVAPAQQQP